MLGVLPVGAAAVEVLLPVGAGALEVLLPVGAGAVVDALLGDKPPPTVPTLGLAANWPVPVAPLPVMVSWNVSPFTDVARTYARAESS